MQQKDIALIVVIAAISAGISWFGSQQLFGTPAKNKVSVEVVRKIPEQFSKPDRRYFHKDSINPTRLIIIDKNDNPNPFNSQSAN